MIIETHDGLQHPRREHVTRIVVSDDYGNPIGVFVEQDANRITAAIADDEASFNKVMQQLGIRRTVLITKVDTAQVS